MMDSIKDYLPPKRFSTLAYVCVILHLICGAMLIAITMDSKSDDMEKFSCAVNTTFATHKTYVEKMCFLIYNDVYNSHIRLFAFVLMSFGSVAVVSLIYSLAVANRVDKTERYLTKRDETQTDAKKETIEPGRKTSYVFYCYFIHLLARFMLGILFTILQYYVFYPNGFDSQFTCVYPEITQPDPTITTATMNTSVVLSNVTCANLAAKDKQFWGTFVTVYNVIVSIIALAEVIYLTLHGFSCFNPQYHHLWSCDSQFITEYFLGKQYIPLENDEFTGVDNSAPNSAQIYKQNVLKASLTRLDINYGVNKSLDEIFIDVVIQTEQAPLKFSKDMTRHEINDVYMTVPKNSIHLKQVEDLFYPNKDTKGNSPRTILAIGRPGIGKTVLSRKIMRDWARGIDRFYHGKIAFFFKFRWFNFEQLQTVTLKKFLLVGSKLHEDEFESVFAEIWANPLNAVFIFDGLDEFGGNLEKFQNFLDQSEFSPDDPSCPMAAMVLFIKILSGHILSEATVLVTSRPTANDVLTKLHFDRKVEILGFTEEKIENYVEQFCANHEKNELKPKIWNHIKSSELKNLCYIPVNCFIVCVTLLNCLGDQGNDIALPTTLTELYQAALVYFHKNLDRNETKEQKKVINDLQQLGFNGMENDQLIFDGEFVNEPMKESGLLHCLPVPIFQIQAQVCFIHLTVQEFLAAKHIVETKEPQDIKEFISSHVKDGKWHLVLQFLAGLLGKKMKMSVEYRSCVLAFGQHLCSEIDNEDCVFCAELNDVMLMKCVRETKSENIAREIAVTSPLKRVTKIDDSIVELSPSDWAAIVFVCKHLNFLTDLTLSNVGNFDCWLEIAKLFRHRCIESLELSLSKISSSLGANLFSSITKSQCLIIHEHSKLTRLYLSFCGVSDAVVSSFTKFLKSVHGICLKELYLAGNGITSVGMSMFCDVLGNEACNKLVVLDLSLNHIGDDGVRILCDALRKKQHGLKDLRLIKCSLTAKCTFWLGQVLRDEHCEITHLSLRDNDLGDEGVRNEGVGILFDTLKVKKCSLTKLDVSKCSLTKKCMTSLCGALGDGNCQLTDLNLSSNDIGDQCVEMLCCVFEGGQCKLTVLNLTECSLTDDSIPSLCEALGNKSCKLTELWLKNVSYMGRSCSPNRFTSEGIDLLMDVEVSEHCKARGLTITISKKLNN